jgi:hypothetical protein
MPSPSVACAVVVSALGSVALASVVVSVVSASLPLAAATGSGSEGASIDTLPMVSASMSVTRSCGE